MSRHNDSRGAESGAGSPRNTIYEEIEHTADWSFRVRGRDLAQLFANAAHALSAMERSGSAKATVTREVQVEGIDRESLLVNWLNELLHLAHTRRETYEQFNIMEIDDVHIRAQIHGHPLDEPRNLIKAVTFHNLEVKQTADGWEATLVLDV